MGLKTIAIAYDCLFPYTTGGGERQYRAFAEELASRGLEVDYVTARQWDESAPAPTGETFRMVEATGRLRLYDADGVRRSAAAVAFAWGLFRTLRRRRRQYDAVIVSALPVLNVFAARAALWGSRARIVVDYLEVWGRRQWLEYAGPVTGTVAWLLQRIAIALSPNATCHSELSAGRLRAEGHRGDLLVSPGLISEGPEQPIVREIADPPFVLYAGRHIPDKRVEALPAAVAHARRTVPTLRLVILGDGPTTATVRAAAATHCATDDWISMPGFVSEDQLERLLSTAACLVNPSRREGYGLVVVEAAAHATPVVLVADEGNAATELVENGVNGYVASSIDAAPLGDAIARAVAEGASLRATTREWYRSAVSTRTIARTIDAIVRHLEQPRADASAAPEQREET